MVDLRRLEQQARTAAGWGRARMASHVAVPVAGFFLVSWLTSADAAVSVALGVTLLAATAALRFWHREGVDAVRLGLTMGAIPLVATVLLRTCGVDCAPLSQFSEAELVCVLAGVAAGAGVTLRATNGRATLRTWGLATGVASLAVALGCVGLGTGGLLVTLAALTVGATVTVVTLRSRLA